MRTITPAITTTGNAWQTVTMPANQVKVGQRIKRIALVATTLTQSPATYINGMERRCVGDIYITLGPVGQTVRLNLTELRLFGLYECIYWEGDYLVDAQQITVGADFVCPTALDAVVLVVDYE